MSERLQQLRREIDRLNDAGVRTTTFFAVVADSLRRSEHLPKPIRRARAMADLLDTAEQVVLPGELIAGSILGIWPIADGLGDYDSWRREAIDLLDACRDRWARHGKPDQGRWAIVARDDYYANIPYDQLQRLIREMSERYAPDGLSPHEIGRELERHFDFDYGLDERVVREFPWVAVNHIDLNYPRILRLGLIGLRDEARAAGEASEDPERRTFYDACVLSAKAAIRFVGRYAQTLEDRSRQDDVDPTRRGELAEMARTCRRVAEAPPETFREAIQLVWMMHVIGCLAEGSALSFARFDQYLWPFYRDDLAAGRITPDEARDLVGCLWLKVNEPHMRIVQSLCLGGVTPDGERADNELTDLCLDVCAELGQPYPNVSVRLGRNSPEWLYDRVVETLRAGIGHPMILNDDVWVPNLIDQGFNPLDARDYYNMGCAEILIQGGKMKWGPGGGVSFPGALELVFRNGRRNVAGFTGPTTGEPETLATFEQFMQAYLAQLRSLLDGVRERVGQWERTQRPGLCDPFGSLLLDDCIARGRDMYQGGCRYGPVRAITGFGLGTAVDSLAAIKRFVYDEGQLTLAELADALETDFAGQEALQRMLAARTPRWGNDLDDVDAIARRVFEAYADITHSFSDGSLTGVFATNLFSYTGHVYQGEIVGATPDGRPARLPLSDAIGPSQGGDRRGPTAVLNSLLSLDPRRVTGASALNLKLTASMLETPRDAESIKAMIRSYIARRGPQLQVNVVDQRALLDARENPQKHRDLVVRVAGFSEYFTSLDEALQDEIIRRTAHARA
jgi:formate C-acetyltransferase